MCFTASADKSTEMNPPMRPSRCRITDSESVVRAPRRTNLKWMAGGQAWRLCSIWRVVVQTRGTVPSSSARGRNDRLAGRWLRGAC